MTDIACWRCGDNFVLRCHGSEHLLNKDECHDLLYHIRIVMDGADESLGADYAGLRESNRRPKEQNHRTPNTGIGSLWTAFGLTHPDLVEKPKLRRI